MFPINTDTRRREELASALGKLNAIGSGECSAVCGSAGTPATAGTGRSAFAPRPCPRDGRNRRRAGGRHRLHRCLRGSGGERAGPARTARERAVRRSARSTRCRLISIRYSRLRQHEVGRGRHRTAHSPNWRHRPGARHHRWRRDQLGALMAANCCVGREAGGCGWRLSAGRGAEGEGRQDR